MLALPLFDDVPPIAVRDPLLKVLGPSDDGEISYGYADAVHVAGHSCPTVAGAFLMAAKGLAHLYPDGRPERGAIRVEMRADRTDGVTGVTARILCLVTGAAEDDGFKGLLGRFDRRGLLSFNAPIPGQVRLTRVDTGASVELDYHPDAMPAFVSPRPVMRKVVAGTATEEEEAAVRELWQNRVRTILAARDNPALIVATARPPGAAATPRRSDSDSAPLRDKARRYLEAARHALTPEFRRRFAELAFRAAQVAEAAVRGDAVPRLPGEPLVTALHLRDRAAYCRSCAAAMRCASVAASLRQAADEYDRDAARLEQA